MQNNKYHLGKPYCHVTIFFSCSDGTDKSVTMDDCPEKSSKNEDFVIKSGVTKIYRGTRFFRCA